MRGHTAPLCPVQQLFPQIISQGGIFVEILRRSVALGVEGAGSSGKRGHLCLCKIDVQPRRLKARTHTVDEDVWLCVEVYTVFQPDIVHGI